MQSSHDDVPTTDARASSPFAPFGSTGQILNIGAIMSVFAVILAAIGCFLPFISLPGDAFQNGAPSSVAQFLSRALYSSFLNALPTVWFFAMVIILGITIASIVGVRFRIVYVGQVTLSAFAIFWGLMTVSTFTEPQHFNEDVHIVLDWGFYILAVAFIISAIAGVISVRWSERVRQRDALRSLNDAVK